jgi:hypothetical protein
MHVALFELLPKIAITIPKVKDKGSFKPMQAQLISIFTSIVANGLPPPLMRLVLTCLDQIFASDLSSLYSLVADLQKAASSRKDLSEPGLISLIDCLAHLSLKLGSYLAASSSATLSIVKTLLNATTRPSPANNLLRSRALHLLASLCEGVHPSDKASPSLHNEGWLVFTRYHSDLSHGDEARVECISILRAIARSRSSTLWLDGGSRFIEAAKACTVALMSLAAQAHSATNDTVSQLSSV